MEKDSTRSGKRSREVVSITMNCFPKNVAARMYHFFPVKVMERVITTATQRFSAPEISLLHTIRMSGDFDSFISLQYTVIEKLFPIFSMCSPVAKK